mmetsp:Transcript_226/g.652  ORF Transcript_226/g.652 Transcript_226/m.652 type:complete len:233 (-) Transcript_226:78-776(-)
MRGRRASSRRAWPAWSWAAARAGWAWPSPAACIPRAPWCSPSTEAASPGCRPTWLTTRPLHAPAARSRCASVTGAGSGHRAPRRRLRGWWGETGTSSSARTSCITRPAPTASRGAWLRSPARRPPSCMATPCTGSTTSTWTSSSSWRPAAWTGRRSPSGGTPRRAGRPAGASPRRPSPSCSLTRGRRCSASGSATQGWCLPLGRRRPREDGRRRRPAEPTHVGSRCPGRQQS